MLTRLGKIESKQRQQKRRRYQKQVAQAQIELAAWYKRQERQGIYDDDLIEAVYAWSQRFSDINSQNFYLASLYGRHCKLCVTNSQFEASLRNGWIGCCSTIRFARVSDKRCCGFATAALFNLHNTALNPFTHSLLNI